MIKAIIFDMGGVVLKVREEEIRKRFCELLGVEERAFKELFDKHLNELMIGKMPVSEFSRLVEKQFGVREVEEKWEQSYRGVLFIREEVMEIAKGLKKRYVVGVISNVLDMIVRMNREDGLYKPFEPVILSCEVGLRKPGKGIFELALKKLGLKAEECVFMDDREENLEEPKEMGFHVIHFKDARQLEKELERLGVELY